MNFSVVGEDKEDPEPEEQRPAMDKGLSKLLRRYLGILLALARPPLRCPEEQVHQMRRWWREDAKSNVRVMEITAGHRNAWQADEKWIHCQIDAANYEIEPVNATVAELRAAAEDWRSWSTASSSA